MKHKEKQPGQISTLIQAIGPGFIPAILGLAPAAYWLRIKQGRSPFSPTLYQRRKSLPKASMEGRVFPDQPYLQPTQFCNSRAPEVIAISDELRQNTTNDWEFVKALYDYVRESVVFALEPPPRKGVVGTLESGFGFCFDKINVLVALARAGGIPARYSILGSYSVAGGGALPPEIHELTSGMRVWAGSSDWRIRKIGEGVMRRLNWFSDVGMDKSMGRNIHTIAELKVEGQWIPADPQWADSEAISLGLPLCRFGYDPITLKGLRGTLVNRTEAAPLTWGFWFARWLSCLVSRGAIDMLNNRLEEFRKEGKQQLSQIGEAEYIRRMKRFYMPLPLPSNIEISYLTG